MLFILKHYRKTKKINSRDQLKADFGEYPPLPLAHADTHHEINIVHAAGLGVIFDTFIVCLAKLRVEVEKGGARLACIEALDGDNRLGGVTNAINHWLRNWNNKPRHLALHIIRIFCVVVIFVGAVWANWSNPNRLGMFYPTGRKQGLILIGDRFKRFNRNIEPLISHEHLHFLQHVDGDTFNDSPRNLDKILPEKHQELREILYVLTKTEVEARLHEIVLSYYRIHKHLPLTITEFYILLAKNSQLKDYIKNFVKFLNIEVDESYREYSSRDPELADDIRKIFRVFNDLGIEFRFVTEVLTVMYGNLIRYYGDHEASNALQSRISRPNLYDMLYGNHPYEENGRYDFNLDIPMILPRYSRTQPDA